MLRKGISAALLLMAAGARAEDASRVVVSAGPALMHYDLGVQENDPGLLVLVEPGLALTPGLAVVAFGIGGVSLLQGSGSHAFLGTLGAGLRFDLTPAVTLAGGAGYGGARLYGDGPSNGHDGYAFFGRAAIPMAGRVRVGLLGSLQVLSSGLKTYSLAATIGL